MTHKLISFVTCPFVQRAVVQLNEKKADFEVEYIDLANKPDWFLKLSPRGKVPLLLAGDVPLFESQAICEYLEEVLPEPALMPSDPVERARDRAWFAFASEDLFAPNYRFAFGTEAEGVTKALELMLSKLSRLEEEMEGRSYLSGAGERFGMADIAMVPFFFSHAHLKAQHGLDVLKSFSNLSAWSARMLERDSVKRSVREDWFEHATTGPQRRGSWFLGNLKTLEEMI